MNEYTSGGREELTSNYGCNNADNRVLYVSRRCQGDYLKDQAQRIDDDTSGIGIIEDATVSGTARKKLPVPYNYY